MSLERYEKLGELFLRKIESVPNDPAAKDFLDSNYYKRLVNDAPDIVPDLAPFGVSKAHLFRYDDIAESIVSSHPNSELCPIALELLEASQELSREYSHRLVDSIHDLKMKKNCDLSDDNLARLGLPVKESSDFENWLTSELSVYDERMTDAGFTVNWVARNILSRLALFRQDQLEKRIEELLIKGVNKFDIIDECEHDLFSVSRDAETAQRFIQEFVKANLSGPDSPD
jgi:hypothetical protein